MTIQGPADDKHIGSDDCTDTSDSTDSDSEGHERSPWGVSD